MFVFLALTLSCAAISACTSRPRVTPPVFTGDVLEVTADADLLRPALAFACSRNDMAILRESELEDGAILFELVTLRDEEATLTATPAAEGAWKIEASVGRFGSEEEERALLALLGDRLYRLQKAGH